MQPIDQGAPLETRGYDAGKKIVGRKRYIAVDTDGRLLMVNLTTVDISDSTGAQQLMVIVPDEAGLEVEARIENKDVGFVQIGQPVEVKVDAFNFTRYGLLQGRVTDITRDAVEQNAPPSGEISRADAQSPQPSSVYIARVAVELTAFETEKGPAAIAPGMTVSAEIKTGRRRVVEYVLSPFNRYVHETVRER